MRQQMTNGSAGDMAPVRRSASNDANEHQREERRTEYKSQMTLTNASTLKEDLRNWMRLSNSKVPKDIARGGVAGEFPR